MKLKSVKLEWNVLYYDFNNKKVKKYNIFSDDIKERLYKDIKSKKINNYEELKKVIDGWAHYRYWSRTECEMAMGGLYCNYPKDFEKVDMYKQIEINLDRIVEYVIRAMDIKFERSK